MVAKVFYATWLAFCIASLPVRVNATENRWKSEKFTIFERQSPDGPRHSPLFSLDVGGDEGTDYPSKMVFFNNDLYGSAAGLVEEDSEDIIGYNQGHCVETVASDGFVAECFFTYVFHDGSSLTANGPFNFDPANGVLPTVLAVTGGTDDFKKYKGEAALSAGPGVDFPSLQFDFHIFKYRY